MDGLSLAGSLVKVALTFGLLFLTLKLIGRLYGGTGGASRRSRHSGQPVEIIGRTSLGRAASIVLVRMGRHSYALGVTQQGVNLLTEVELDDDPTPAIEAAASPASPIITPRIPARTQGPVSSPSWRDVMESLRERTVRR